MKKLSLKLDSMSEMLSREQMKMIIGGADYGGGPSAPPTGPGSDVKSRKCCWEGFRHICSYCVDVPKSAYCVDGAFLADC